MFFLTLSFLVEDKVKQAFNIFPKCTIFAAKQKCIMNYLEFRNKMFDLGCFNIHQVYAWKPGFHRNNFVRWTKKGLTRSALPLSVL